MMFHRLTLLLCGVLFAAATAGAITVATPPAGYACISAGGGRDTWLSIPLVRRAEFVGRVTSAGPDTLVLADAAWTPGAYAPSAAGSYYVQFVTGNLAGLTCRVLNNTSSQLTVATLGDDLSAHPLGAITSGDVIRLRPYWTIADIFGSAAVDVLLTPSSVLPGFIYQEGDSLLLPDEQSIGTEKPAAATIQYVTSSGWRRLGQPAVDAGAIELAPGRPFVWRRQGTDVSSLVVGYVAQEPGVIRFPALPADGETDVPAALFSPLPRSLADSGLASVIDSSADADHARDLLLSPADVRGGFALPPARRLHRTDSSWFEGATAADGQLLRPGAGFLIRLRGERPVRFWRQDTAE